jgi:hypothetical protein
MHYRNNFLFLRIYLLITTSPQHSAVVKIEDYWLKESNRSFQLHKNTSAGNDCFGIIFAMGFYGISELPLSILSIYENDMKLCPAPLSKIYRPRAHMFSGK